MFDSEEELVMDFGADEKRTHLANFHLDNTASDCTTISASECSHDEYDSTPPLFYKLKKARVLIKKLPRDLLAKYKINCDETSLRSSGRLKSKNIPVGKYLALHSNKPLYKVLSKKKRRTPKISNNVEKTKSQHQKINIISPECNSMKRSLKFINLSRDASSKSKDVGTLNKFESTISRNENKKQASSLTKTADIDKRTAIPLNNPRSLHERIVATRIMRDSTRSSLPKLPEVVITRYDSPRSINHFIVNETRKNVPISITCNTLQSGRRSDDQKLYSKQNVQSKVVPAFLIPAPSANKSGHLIPSSAGVNSSSDGLQRHSLPQRKFTVQAFKIPNDPSKSKDPIPVTSPKVFVVNQSLLATDPVNTPDSEVRLTCRENIAGNSTSICVDSDSDLEQIDAEEHIQPEVIKRIVCHTKAVQTKFTCNSSICGLVDTDEFNLNCFYCYDIFPLHKWFEFKKHIKVVHHVEERANLLDSDAESHNSGTQNRLENSSNRLSPIPRYTNENDERSFTTKTVNTTEQVYKKLPLEPRLLAQRENKIITESSKLFLSTPKTDKPSQIVDQSEKSIKSVKFNNIQINETISLDSDEGGLRIENRKDAENDMLLTNKKSQSYSKDTQANDFKLVLPSLPHITIKKINGLSKENIDASRTASKTMPLNEKVIKKPFTTNIQKIIKTLPKPTKSQLTANGETRPRYFVVRKIIQLPETDASKLSDLHTPIGTIIKQMPKASASMGTADNVEDSVPRPTGGMGILFGLTNSMVVIEFLLKLKTFPELWRCQLKSTDPLKYNESIKKLCFHLNSRFDLNITEYEMLLSIQRVKDWYYLMLQSIHEHNKDPSNAEPYKHRFPIYFRILSQYLTPDTDEKGVRLNEIIHKTTLIKASDANLNKSSPNANETKAQSSIENTSILKPSIASSSSKECSQNQNVTAEIPNKSSPNANETKAQSSIENTSILKPSIASSSSKECSQNQNVTAEIPIEFDADTLYDQKSSDEEPLIDFDSEFFKKKVRKITNTGGMEKKRTKVYLGTFECDVCHKVFKRDCDLRRHRVLHFPPQFECDQCSQKFYYWHRAAMCRHVINTSGYVRVDKTSGEKRIWPKKIFRFNMICEICGNSYRSIGSLNTHKKDKHFNKRDRCIVCNFTALSNWRIIQHQRKRHIVEPGLPEDVAKKSRARTETKTSFSSEARQAFDWRREMRKTMKPGEKFFGCCRCKIIFNTRKEKVLHNKTEHPITEDTVICLLCLPNKLLLSNSNSARRHYTDIHKVPWHEIDGLVKCTKPIFKLLNKEEIELLKASENYKELLDELLKDKKLQPDEKVQIIADETAKAVRNLPHMKEIDGENMKTEAECLQQENVCVDGVTDNDHYSERNYKQFGYASINEHDYSEEHVINKGFDGLVDIHKEDELYSRQPCGEEIAHINADTEGNDFNMGTYIQNDQGYNQTIVGDFVEGELVEESIVVEEYIDDIIGEDEIELV